MNQQDKMSRNRLQTLAIAAAVSLVLPGVACAGVATGLPPMPAQPVALKTTNTGGRAEQNLPPKPASTKVKDSKNSAAATVPAIEGTPAASELSNSADEWKKLIAAPPQGKESYQTRQEAINALMAAKRAGRVSSLPPIAGSNGAILYPYGQSWPTVVASPGNISIIELGKGDKPGQVVIGAPGEWNITQAVAGSRPILAITPRFAKLHTNLMVTATSAQGHSRVYYVNLVSDHNQYVPRVGFYYPNQQETQWKMQTQATAQQRAQVAQQTVAAMPSVNPASLDYNWSVHCGAGGWWSSSDCGDIKPLQVFSDNRQVFIKMRPNIVHQTLPTVVSYNLGNQPAIINYRFKNGYYIVDGVPHEIDLVLGTGSHAKVVTIKHK
ncbi:TrbG/VirB9 family P-type conjugative transfer protein [Acidithiobacillus ferrooxidans]|uniref:TrbG/VirB9 family P-type conjugative transfer protein n=1 Tax=Acidithiobacillus ferrooxidans TaxID=920 RepID=UPI000AF0F37F|nr:TrbG/VirB9 family P-type conjugative transfer protein [Acidithiobacillus ferrooxidans]